MHSLRHLPRSLLELPWLVRLNIVIFSCIFCLLVFIRFFVSAHNGSILTVPVALAAWLFGKRGMAFCTGAIAFVIVIVEALQKHTAPWSPGSLLLFFVGFLALLVQGLIISTLRDMLDTAEMNRRKAELAELQISQAYEQQRHLHQSRERLMAHVSHEFRTPLTEVSGYIELLLGQQEQLDPSLQRTFLKHALHGCEELELLVNNVQDAMESVKAREMLVLEDLSIIDVLQNILKQSEPLHQQKYSLEILVTEPFTVHANAHYVSHIFRNLLSNAYKYASQENAVLIKVELDTAVSEGSSSNAMIRISVQDHGPGIPPDELPQLFEPFTRLRRHLSGSIRGAGLGLYTSKQLVEAMGGRIWGESSGIAGLGSRFCFTLPCAFHTRVSTQGIVG